MNIPSLWWHWENKTSQNGALEAIRCGLCFHHCLLTANKKGFCNSRFYSQDGLRSPYLGYFSSIAVDPMEKKPLYHFMPGTQILSLGSIGCTMNCVFCQNFSIAHPQKIPPLHALSPEELLELLRKNKLKSVAYTYNEPTLQAEYILQASPILKENKIAVVLVTNGLLAQEPLKDLLVAIDALNIDLKTFNPKKYRRLGGSLETVLETIKTAVAAEKHVELTTLLVPGISDDRDEFLEMINWIARVSPKIPLHLSRYFPANKYTNPATDLDLMQEFQRLAKQKLNSVYTGNLGFLRAPRPKKSSQ